MARSEVLQGDLPRSEWCVVTRHDCTNSRDSWVYLIECFQVPVIAVFTKYDQFRRNVEMDMSDYPDKYLDSNVSPNQVAEKQFQDYYLRPLGNGVRHVRLESTSLGAMCQPHILMLLWQRCTRSIATATALLRRRL